MNKFALHMLPRAVAAALLAVGAMPAAAVDLDYTVRLGLQHNDNINFSETDPVSENIFIPGIDFTLQQDGARLRVNLAGSLEYRKYLDGTYDSTTRSALNGLAEWILVPQRLNWSFQDNRSVQPINELAADSPDNQQQTNAFATGPSLLFGAGKAINGQFDLRYIESHAEQTQQFDTRRTAAALNLGHDIDATSRISANVNGQAVRFKHAALGADFTRYDLYADYSRKLNRLDLDLAAGYSQLDFDNATMQDSNGPLLRLSLGWQPETRSRFNLSLARQYTDAADAMLGSNISGTLPSGVNTGDASVTAQAYLQRSVDLGYSWQGERAGFTLTPYWRDYDYPESTTLDRQGRGFNAGVGYRLRPRLSLGISASAERETYQAINRNDRTRSLSASLDYQMTRRLNWNLSYTRYERRSSIAGQSSNQNVVYFQLILRR